jgi:mRNA interferase MazF
MPAPRRLLRGRVYAATLEHVESEKYYLVVSNNRRNQRLPRVLAVRLTTTPKPPIPTVVELDDREPFTGRVLCDDIETLYPDEVRRDVGTLSPGAMARVEAGLRAALDL